MKVGLAQIDPTIADIDGNTDRVLRRIDEAGAAGARLVVFPELAVFGYPPRDLVQRRDLIERNVAAIQRIASRCTHLTACVGYVFPDPSGSGQGALNAAAICQDGAVHMTYAKRLLPTYDVFDERRYFNPGGGVGLFDLSTDAGSLRVGVTICEDLWNDHQFGNRHVYDLDPVEQSVAAGAQLLINLSGSPYRVGAQLRREKLFSRQVARHGVPLVYVNQVGGNDDLIFEGASLVLDSSGNVRARARSFSEDLLVVDIESLEGSRCEPLFDDLPSIRQAIILGIRDYLRKCGFTSVVLGLSGGIDSAVTAALAVDAIGAKNVHGVAMPSRFSSDHSVEDARRLADTLGIRFSVIPIEEPHRAMEVTLAPVFEQVSGNNSVAEENVQARIRGTILMSLSNQAGSLLLTTGNKSELAVGYCTLYGDMCGGLAVLSDVPKTVVYELARLVNKESTSSPIPQRTIDKPPSAELRENQCDQDTLPPYDLLDAVLERYVEREWAVEEITQDGFDRSMVDRIVRMVDGAEYKRRQAAVGLKVTSRAFGTGRRMPIAAKPH